MPAPRHQRPKPPSKPERLPDLLDPRVEKALSRLAPLERVDAILERAIPKMQGWCSVPKAQRVARLVVEMGQDRAPLCIEIGVFGGRGTVAMALPILHALQGRGHIDGIDPFTAEAALEGDGAEEHREWWGKTNYAAILKRARHGITSLGLDSIVTLRIERGQDVVDEYESASIDVLHFDANHAAEIALRDAELWAPKVSPYGYFVFDDTNWESTKPAQEKLTALGFELRESYDSWAIYRAPGP